MNIRNCLNCDVQIEYTNKRSWYNAKKRNSKCKECSISEIKSSLKEKVEDGWKPYIRQKNEIKDKKYNRECPSCNTPIYYTSEKGLKNGLRNNTMCNSCSAIHYNKTFKDVISEDAIKQMRATKAGFSNWDQYVEKYPKKQFYKREVWKYTYRNDLKKLQNFDKRGRNGVDGAYQIDHIISINQGWEIGIPAEEIGKISNLRMITWEDNRKKW